MEQVLTFLANRLKQESLLIIFMFIITGVLWKTNQDNNDKFIKLIEENIKTNKELQDFMKSQREIDKLYWTSEMNAQNTKIDRLESKIDMLLSK